MKLSQIGGQNPFFQLDFFFNISKTEFHHATTSWINWAMGNPRSFLCTMKCRKHRCCLFKLSNKFPDGSSRVCYRLVGFTNVVNAKLEHVCKIFRATNIGIIRNSVKVCTNSNKLWILPFSISNTTTLHCEKPQHPKQETCTELQAAKEIVGT